MKKNDYVYVCVDFDGTVVTHEYPDIGKPVSGAVECLKKLQNAGVKIVLNTMRCGNHLLDAVNYFQNNNIELYGINHNPDQDSWTNSPKVYGHFYIDDAAVGCPLIYPSGGRPYVDWIKIEEELLLRLRIEGKLDRLLDL